MPKGIRGFQKGHKIRLGKKHTKETREKISKANKGKKKNYPVWNKGKKGLYKHTEEIRKKISKARMGMRSGMLGKKHSEETKKKMSESQPKGERHYRWNFNREEVRKNLRNDGEYCQWVKRIKRRDKQTCKLKNENCFGYNIVHHIKNWSDYPELRYEVNNGITLCQAHHPRGKAKEKELEDLFQSLIQVSSV